ncbi:DUF6625 family protein [Butyrivibrio sp. AE3004]|uniref:DUF6625 family protein n=1 Tax=Butyrivibrio sp. AE3004 TaxID=1506994 RepID=UPI00068B496A|nr:DUF6625 family protein [Butyrivibrio sp. AE3004]
MKSIVVIVPYFGELPPFYPMWEKSVLHNESIDFVLFTDDKNVSSIGNLRVEHMSFEEYKYRIQSRFPFDVCLEKPYKICDFRPAFGYCFSDIIEGYDFWGYCDLDLTFGDIRSFVSDKILNDYDRIFVTGHFSLYRNTDKIVKLFMNNGDYPEYNYTEAFKNNDSCYFDEFRGMELKCLRNGIKVFTGNVFADYKPEGNSFYNRKKENVIVIWDRGKLYEVTKKGDYKELLYAHYQKRKMILENISSNKVYIAAGIISDKPRDHTELFEFKSGSNLGYKYLFKIKKLKKAIAKYGLLGLYKKYKRCKEIEKLKNILVLNNNQQVDLV